MPAIDTPLLLDILLGLIILLFVPFGVRRGVAKEAIVSGGLLLGAAVAAAWAESAGDDLADWLDLGSETARFTVAAAALGGGALILGYGGGAALGRLRQGVLARLTGGLLAALNGALLLAYLLAFVQRFLRPGRDPGVVDDGVVGRALVRELDWLLLGAAAAMALCVVLGLIVTGFRRRNEPGGVDGAGAVVPPRQRPVRVPRDVDAGKYEPTSPFGSPGGSDPRPGRFGGSSPGLGHTTPLPDPPERWRIDDPPERDADRWPRPRAMLDASHATNGHAPTPPLADDWLRRTGTVTPLPPSEPTRPDGGATEGIVPPGPGNVDTAPRAGAASEPEENAGTSRRRCPACGAGAGARDLFCPECGTTL